MKQNYAIRNLMTDKVVSVTRQTKLSEARKIFNECGFHHLPVVEGERLIGILSYNDLMRIDSGELYKQDPKQADALIDNLSSMDNAMTSNVISVHADDSVKDATVKLAEGNFHALPIVDSEYKLMGIVTSTDLLRYYLNQY